MKTSRSWRGAKLQSGQAAEIAAEHWFKTHDWHMVRTQPPITILAIITGPIIKVLSSFFPRMAFFGHMVIARLGKGGQPDYTGYRSNGIYTCCEVKQVSEGNTMPASRLDKEQRAFMDALGFNGVYALAFVGILWPDGIFEVFRYIPKGSYKKGEDIV